MLKANYFTTHRDKLTITNVKLTLVSTYLSILFLESLKKKLFIT